MEGALNNAVLEKVLLAVEKATYARDSRIRSTTRLADDLELGRFGLLRLALCLEEIFDIELPDEALKRFFSLGDIVKYLSRHYFQDVEFPALAAAA